MKILSVSLTGGAEEFYKTLKSEGLSDASIVGKGLTCLEMVRSGVISHSYTDLLEAYNELKHRMEGLEK
jgi:hypothetical protein